MNGNRIIARFMGFESYPFENKGGKGFDVTLNGVPKDNCNHKYSIAKYGDLEYNIEQILQWELKYDKCWNWLMPVQKKIGDVYAEDAQRLHFEKAELFDDMQLFLFNGQMEELHKSIVEFIEWYNEFKEGEEKIKEKD